MDSRDAKKLERVVKQLQKAAGLACDAKQFAAEQGMREAYEELAEAHLALVKATSDLMVRLWDAMKEAE